MDIALHLGFVWLTMLVAGFVNGAARDKLLLPLVGKGVALPLSGVTLSILVFAIIHFSVSSFGTMIGSAWLLLGAVWVLITLVFEVVYTLRKGVNLAAIFSVHRGNLFALVLLVILLAPLLCARYQGLVAV